MVGAKLGEISTGRDRESALYMIVHDYSDWCLMRELKNPRLPRATWTPITLATIGLDSQEVRAIARELRQGI